MLYQERGSLQEGGHSSVIRLDQVWCWVLGGPMEDEGRGQGRRTCRARLGLTSCRRLIWFLAHVNVAKSIWMTCVGVSRKASGCG